MALPLIGVSSSRFIDKDGRMRDGLGPSYSAAILQAGGVPVIIPIGVVESDDESLLRTIYERVDGILLPGGGDIHPSEYGKEIETTLHSVNPLRDKVELKLARWAYEDDRPLFGICRGNQVINVALGGTLIQDIPSTQPSSPLTHDRDDLNFALLSHEIDVKPESRLASILTQPTVKVNSLHHQAVLELAPVLKVNARASDGVVEGVEVPDAYFYLGVQWHPEELQNLPEMQQLFKAFIEACAARIKTVVP